MYKFYFLAIKCITNQFHFTQGSQVPGCKKAGWHSGQSLFSPYQLFTFDGIFNWYELRAFESVSASRLSFSRGKEKLGIENVFLSSTKFCSGSWTVFLKKLVLNWTEESVFTLPVVLSSMDLAVGVFSSVIKRDIVNYSIEKKISSSINSPFVSGSLNVGGSRTNAGTLHFHW